MSTAKRGWLDRMGMVMNRALASVSMRFHVSQANLWRDNYNPLRHLTIQRCVHLLEEGERGAYLDLQWTYRFIEMQDATLGALIERRTSAIQKLDWNIKVRDEIPAGKEAIARRQEEALKAAYDRVTNLSAALEFLALASFRGFSHLEMVEDGNGDVTEFGIVDQWFWVRSGIYGDWQINRESRMGVTEGEAVPLPRFIIREVARPINRVALIAFVRKGLSQKDWDGFIETFGIPAVFLIMPPDVPADREEEYFQTADEVVSNARGSLPHGADIKTVDNGARGVNPFKEHLSFQDEQVVLRGTGGKLTMLAESGSGTLAGNAHSDTFEEIAKAEAKEISEVLRKSFDKRVLDIVTPGEPALAYFELAANEETDTTAVVKDVGELSRSGYDVEPAFIEEKTGYKVMKRVEAPPVTTPVLNRKGADGEEWKRFAIETGTLGIPRSTMPQIQSGNRASMVNKLRAQGIDYVRLDMKPSDLKPTQAEYCPAKVEKAKGYEGTPRAILVGSDNHVIDGHHQYMAALQTAPNVPIPVFKIKTTALHAIGLLLQMPSTGQEPLRNRSEAEYAAEFRASLAEDLQPLGRALEQAMNAGDGPAVRTALKKLSERMPDFLESPTLSALLGDELLQDLADNAKP